MRGVKKLSSITLSDDVGLYGHGYIYDLYRYTRSTIYIRMKWKKHTSMKYFWTPKLKSSALQITERCIALMTRRGLGVLILLNIFDEGRKYKYFTSTLTIQCFALIIKKCN